ncbi:MAG TPA: barstar family protein [Bacteroidota bacterium]|nr:barstar family protein [Bacteroidota bacterium]
MTGSLSWPSLLKRGSEWSHVAAVPRIRTEEFASTVPPRKHAAVRILRGKKCATRDEMFDEFARALDFPHYFSRTWDSLEECLTDLEWLSAEAFVLIITNADQLLKSSPADLKALAGILASSAGHWNSADPPASFHCLFQCEPGSADDLTGRLAVAGILTS